MTTIHEFDIRQQLIDNITILNDRAEIRRLVKVSVKEGVNEVQLKNFSHCFQRDSARVEGKGKATICDVTGKEVPALRSETDTPKVAELRKQLDNYNGIRKKLEDQRDILNKKMTGLDRSVGEIGKSVVKPPKDAGAVVFDDTLLEGLQKLFDYHEEQAEKLKQNLREKNEEIEKTTEMCRKIESEMNDEVNLYLNGLNYSHNVIITLEAVEDGDVELEVTYQVFGAGWEPSYDIRVDTEKPSMLITYYGKIYNGSGEDWNDFSAVLSTAQPCLGGHIPELGTLDAHFDRPVRQMSLKKKSFGVRMMRRGGGRGSSSASNEVEEDDDMGFAACGMQEECAIKAPQMEVTQKALSTEYKIAKKTTIPDGTQDHKVTIGTTELTPTLVHESVPSKNAAAFLTASAVNSSSLAFLAGESSIFLDNAFVAKSYMKNVSPGERFTCSLGVDTAIRVEYKAAKKYHEEGGYITKHSANVTEQTISVKNTRSEQPVLLTIKHHVPRSTDEKIRVKLISPAAAPFDSAAKTSDEVVEPKEGVKMNKDNNLEWTVNLAPNSLKNLVVKWVVEHPKGQRIELREKC